MLLASLPACRDASTASLVVRADEEPAAAADASTPFVTVASDGTQWMTWMEPTADSMWTVRVAHRPPRGHWITPATVVSDRLLFANWADFPSIVVDAQGRLVVHFLRRSALGKYSYHAWVTTSADRGATWSAPERLHRDTSATEHGFVALIPLVDGTTAAAWLDGRGTGGEAGAMSLAYGVVDASGHVRGDTILDARTCDCCQVAAARTPDGAVFAYRDRSEGEVRDIAVVRQAAGRWWPPVIVHADGWVTRACPVNGPALAAADSVVAIAWFTNARDTAKVQVAFSDDRGATWGAPLPVDDGKPVGRADIELLGDQRALVTWMERTGKGAAEIRAKVVARTGTVEGKGVITATSDARPAGFPRIAAIGDREVLVAWRELGAHARLRVALVSVSAPLTRRGSSSAP